MVKEAVDPESKTIAMQRSLKRKSKRIRTLYIVCALLAILLVGGGAYGYSQYQKLKNENARLSNPEESAKAEKDKVKKQVEKLVDTPKDEEPIIATVTDVDKLKSQPFYANAQNNDKALFYEKSKRAILYRPATNKIINTSTLEIKNTPTNPAKTTTPAKPGSGVTPDPASNSSTDPTQPVAQPAPVANPYQ